MRRLDDAAETVILERGRYVSFANCGLPYHVDGEIPDRASLLLQTPESLAASLALDVRTGHEVVRVDPIAKEVTGQLITNRIGPSSWCTTHASTGNGEKVAYSGCSRGSAVTIAIVRTSTLRLGSWVTPETVPTELSGAPDRRDEVAALPSSGPSGPLVRIPLDRGGGVD